MERRNRQRLNTVNRDSNDGRTAQLGVAQSQNVLARQSGVDSFVRGLQNFHARSSQRRRIEDAQELREAKVEDAQGEAAHQRELVGVEDDAIQARAEIRQHTETVTLKQALLDSKLDLTAALEDNVNDPEFDIRTFAQEYTQDQLEALGGLSPESRRVYEERVQNVIAEVTFNQEVKRRAEEERSQANQISQLFLTAVEGGPQDLVGLMETMRTEGNGFGFSRQETDEILVNAAIPQIRQGNLELYEAMSKDRPRGAGSFTKDPAYSAALESAKVAGEKFRAAQVETNNFRVQYTKATTKRAIEDAIESGEWPQDAIDSAIKDGLVTGGQVVGFEDKYFDVVSALQKEATIRHAVASGNSAALLNDPDIDKADIQDIYDVMTQEALETGDPAQISQMFSVGDQQALMSSSLKTQLNSSLDLNNPQTFQRVADQVISWQAQGHSDYLAANLSDSTLGRVEAYQMLTKAGMEPLAVIDRLANSNIDVDEARGRLRGAQRDFRETVEDIADGGFFGTAVTHVGDVERTLRPMVQAQLMMGLDSETALDVAQSQWKKTYTRVGSFIARRDANVPSEFPKAANDFLENILPGKLREAGLEPDDDYTLGLSSVPGKFVIYPVNSAGGTLIDPETGTAVMLDAIELTNAWRLENSRSNNSQNRINREAAIEISERADGRG